MSPLKIIWTVLAVVALILEAANSSPLPRKKTHPAPAKTEPTTTEAQKFYEVDALGDDYVDFGAATGPKGSYSWHATYRLEH